jgi:Tfp pilus assembly protein PilV
VEVLVALAVFAVFAAGMAGLVIGLVNANANSKDRDAGVFLALDRLETIRNTPYPNIIPANFPTEGYGTITFTLGNPPASYPDFQRSVSIQDNVPMAGVKRVVVTVTSRRGVMVTEEMMVGQ